MTCPRCQQSVAPNDVFCEHCGVRLSWARAGCVGCGSVRIGADGFCEECGRAQPSDRDRIELSIDGLAGGISDRGRRRRRNEDAMACLHIQRSDDTAVVAVVCDGVASVQRGDEAAQIAALTASEVLIAALKSEDDDLPAATRDAAQQAGAAVAALAAHDSRSPHTVEYADGGAPSSTYISAVVTGDQVVIGWIGDSRAYWLGERSRRLTSDHTLDGVLIRWLGADADEADPQVSVYQPDGSGALLLCTDGLWNYLPEPDELAALALPSALVEPFTAADALVQRALDAGGRDNITVVVVPFPPLEQM